MNRYRSPLGLAQYAVNTSPIYVGSLHLNPINMKVLRMLVQAPYSRGLKLPTELEWVRPMLEKAEVFQRDVIGVIHPHTYVTVRSGPVDTHSDDVWHVDGFSTKYTHLPEANYVWVRSSYPTQYLDQRFEFPSDFDPRKHNVHKYFQHEENIYRVKDCKSDTLYFMDPYVIHRRPPSTAADKQRTFVRISFTPIEIPDPNNTTNPLISTPHYVIDGVKEFRDGLGDYHGERA